MISLHLYHYQGFFEGAEDDNEYLLNLLMDNNIYLNEIEEKYYEEIKELYSLPE